MPLLWISLCFLLGIVAGNLFSPGWWITAIMVVISLGLLGIEQLILRGHRWWRQFRKSMIIAPWILLLSFSLGLLRFAVGEPVLTDHDLAYYNDRGEYLVTARVSAPPDKREDAVLIRVAVFEMQNLSAENPVEATKRVKGNALIRIYPGVDYAYGDLLRFIASPGTPADNPDFSYKAYLARQGISTIIYYPQHVQVIETGGGNRVLGWLFRLRELARQTIFRQFPQPESALLSGILLGLDNDLPLDLKNAYQQTGTAHIIAISGFNMAMLAGMLIWVFSRLFNPYRAAPIAAFVIILYTIFVGGSPSVVRAAVMSSLAMGAHLIGRRQSGSNALMLTAAVMCLVNPLLPGDVSFQLSFCATLGLVLFSSPLEEWTQGLLEKHFSEEKAGRLGKTISDYFLLTLAAQVATLPVIAIQFGRISVSSILANPLVLPAQPALLIGGGITTLIGMIIPIAGKVLAMFAWPLLAYTNWIVVQFAKIRGGSLVIHSQLKLWIAIVFIVFLLLFLFRNYFKKLFGKYFPWLVFVLILISFSIGSIAFHLPDGALHVNLLRAGDESTIFFRSPGGQSLVIDPGKNVNELSAAVNRQLSPWNFHIDGVFITNRSAANNLEMLSERIPVTRAIFAPSVYQVAANARPLYLPSGIEVVKVQTSQGVGVGSQAIINIVAEDTQSTALLLEYDQTRILIPNGVDYALIHETAPDSLTNLTALILDDRDISYIPPRVWISLNPQFILWNSASLAPVQDWYGTDTHTSVEIESEGIGISLHAQ